MTDEGGKEKPFYFLYGEHGYPFHGGWSIVYASGMVDAINKFRNVHPDVDGRLNCESLFGEEFERVYWFEHGNYGEKCHEVIR